MSLEGKHSRLAVAACLMPGVAIMLLALIVVTVRAAAAAIDPSGRPTATETLVDNLVVVLACITLACPLVGGIASVVALRDPCARRESAWCGLILNVVCGGVLGFLLAAWISFANAMIGLATAGH